MEWRDFIWCRHWIHYPQESAKPKTSARLQTHKEAIFKSRAIVLTAATQRKGKQGSRMEGHIAGRYKTIESLMFKVFPRFDWPGILKDRQGVPESVTCPFDKRALEVCRRKLAGAREGERPGAIGHHRKRPCPTSDPNIHKRGLIQRFPIWAPQLDTVNQLLIGSKPYQLCVSNCIVLGYFWSNNLAATYSRGGYTTTTIGNATFDGRVRNGIGSDRSFMATKKVKNFATRSSQKSTHNNNTTTENASLLWEKSSLTTD